MHCPYVYRSLLSPGRYGWFVAAIAAVNSDRSVQWRLLAGSSVFGDLGFVAYAGNEFEFGSDSFEWGFWV
ncbi:hypothetical protein SO802_024370 [Lithocarpus litseifolius]|uniref:Uncharacterized protein n=1 Tax=Lithocarpus litseifolius TaxID=425828 RepID=A0AAW2CBG7_9ROSI